MPGPEMLVADRIEWLVQHRWPAGAPEPKTNNDAAAAITAATGVELSGTGFWKLRTGRGANPTLKTLNALASFFKVPLTYFGEDSGAEVPAAEQYQFMALLRSAGLSGERLRVLTELSPGAREVVSTVIDSLAVMERDRAGGDHLAAGSG